jgi:hypothetical protein
MEVAQTKNKQTKKEREQIQSGSQAGGTLSKYRHPKKMLVS